MNYFVFSGRERINLKLKNAQFLCRKIIPSPISISAIKKSFKKFFEINYAKFLNKKVCVIIPDNTRDCHPKEILRPFAKCLRKIARDVDFIISRGLHKRLGEDGLEAFLGREFVKNNRVIQSSLDTVRFLGSAGGVPLYLDKNVFLYDVIFTLGVVEPHLYAGFSGGIKCIAIGLAGKETILNTHSIKFLSRKGVGMASIRTNPFQIFLWKAVEKIGIPIFSLNIVNNLQKKIAFYSLGKAKDSFLESVRFAERAYAYKIKEKFDILLVGCDFPKDKSLYQASRLFNYVLDKKPLVRKAGAIFVFAGLDGGRKSKAEKNFESLLKKRAIPENRGFKKIGEHRAFKVIEASCYATLGIVTPNTPKDKFSRISFFKNYTNALKWSKKRYKDSLKIGVIPLGFSFIPY